MIDLLFHRCLQKEGPILVLLIATCLMLGKTRDFSGFHLSMSKVNVLELRFLDPFNSNNLLVLEFNFFLLMSLVEFSNFFLTLILGHII